MGNKSIIYVCILFFITGCKSSKIGTFTPDLTEKDKKYYHTYFNKEQIKNLKKEWVTLYQYCKKGHLLKGSLEGETTYIYSYEFYKFLNKNQLRIYETNFLKNLDNFIAVFGEPNTKYSFENDLQIGYFPLVLGNSCKTCTYNGFSYVFDKKTKNLQKK